MSKLLEQLNEKQKEAVLQTEGPVLILAGAGSGKTRALTFRVAYLIKEKRIPPKNILAVTFTNKAAGEMLDRVRDLLGLPHTIPPYSSYLPHVGTFHAVCVRILRKEIEKVGYKKNFTIYDDQDQLAVMRSVMKKLGISQDQIKPKAILGTISDAKNKLIGAKQFEEQAGSFFEEQVAKGYLAYQKELKDIDALDFDDIIMITVKIFQKYPDVLERYQKLFRYILVDEYQDTNHAQYMFLKLLAREHRNICVVGDDWQCLPKGTRIKTDDGWKKIEKIKKGDRVLAAAGRGDTHFQKVTRIKNNNYKGELLEIITKKGRRLQCTPNHILFSKLSAKEGIFYVYLMYSGKFGYRIGQVKGLRYQKRENKNCIGLNVRANQERADRMWILKITRSKEDALYWEQYLSLKYQIPTSVFLAKKERKMKFSQNSIDKLFSEIDTRKNAKKLFHDLDLYFDYPHHMPQATIRLDTKRKKLNLILFHDKKKSFVNPWNGHRISINSTDQALKKELEKLGIHTRKGKGKDWRAEISNLDLGKLERMGSAITEKIKGLEIAKKAFITKGKPFNFHPAGHIRQTMKVCCLVDGQIGEEEIAKVEKVPYDGKVYDIDVENVHNYLAEGVFVHNSIYGWRGADVQNILDFEKDYPDAKVVLLEQNYRSTQNILDAAHCVITKNVNRKDKKLWTDNEKGSPLALFEAQDELDESRFVVEQIDALKKELKLKLDDFAVLYRTNAQSRALEEAFMRAGIPYKIVGGLKFYQRKEIKDILSYLVFLRNPKDHVSFERIVNVPPKGIGDKTVGAVKAVADEFGIDLVQAIKKIQDGKQHASKIAPSKIKILGDFCKMVGRFQKVGERVGVSKLVSLVYEGSGYQQMLSRDGEEGLVRHENIQELLTVAQKYDDQEDGTDLFLEEVALVSQTDTDLGMQDMVPMMTLHSAKGLEYEVIFIVGMEEGLLPHSRAILSEKEMEEERRLCYVGITRAKQKAHLVHTMARTIFGSTQISVRSRFLDEIDGDLFEEMRTDFEDGDFFEDMFENREQKRGFIKKTPDILPLVEKKNKHASEFKDGERVKHDQFGEGIVVAHDEKTVSVAFAGLGLKKLAKGIAPLKKI